LLNDNIGFLDMLNEFTSLNHRQVLSKER
jgi:hypothetical protein